MYCERCLKEGPIVARVRSEMLDMIVCLQCTVEAMPHVRGGTTYHGDALVIQLLLSERVEQPHV